MPQVRPSVCMIKNIVLINILLFSSQSPFAAENPCDSGSAIGKGECATISFEKKDKELNTVYKEVLNSLPQDTLAYYPRTALVAAEKEWIQFRDNECNLQGELSGGVRMWRSTYTVWCQSELTEQRVVKLKQYLACNLAVAGVKCMFEKD